MDVHIYIYICLDKSCHEPKLKKILPKTDATWHDETYIRNTLTLYPSILCVNVCTYIERCDTPQYPQKVWTPAGGLVETSDLRYQFALLKDLMLSMIWFMRRQGFHFCCTLVGLSFAVPQPLVGRSWGLIETKCLYKRPDAFQVDNQHGYSVWILQIMWWSSKGFKAGFNAWGSCQSSWCVSDFRSLLSRLVPWTSLPPGHVLWPSQTSRPFVLGFGKRMEAWHAVGKWCNWRSQSVQ